MTDNRLQIETPENLTLEAEIAGFGSRFLAATADYTLLIIVIFILGLLFSRSLPTIEDSTYASLLVISFTFLSIVLYHLFFELVWNGQTPGKRWLGIRVVQVNGMPASGSALIVRNLVRLFDFLPALYGVGILSLFLTKQTQRLGDLAAGTIVIYERPQVELRTIKQDMRVHYRLIKTVEPIPSSIDISRLTREDYQAIVNYLQRRSTLTNDYLAVAVAKKVADQMDYQDNRFRLNHPADAELFLEWVARAFELRGQ
ncbi:MAG: RDD family protein [Chitinophagaceae bacterium]|nr:RDD family protein [Anaerolineae bacterium]